MLPEITKEMRDSIDSIKAELESGGARGIVARERQSGKSTALLEFVHEHDPANMIVVCCNWQMRQFMKGRYKTTFPNDPIPYFVSIQNVKDSDICGTNRRWVSDEVWPGSVVDIAHAYELAPHLGTVGTPMCMDMHR